MDNNLFLQHLRDLPLQEGRVYISEHIAELSDHATIGNLLADEALHLLYTPFVSLKLAELLIFFGEYVHHTSSHALGLKAKGDVLFQVGHYQAAMDSLDAAGAEFLALGEAGNWARSRITWIIACAWLGGVEEALQEAGRAREVFLRLGEYYWIAIIDSNTAMIYEDIGRYQDALKLYENMLAIFPTVTDQSELSIKRSIAITQVNQATNLSWLGHFEQAYRLVQEAQASFIALAETGLIIHPEIDLARLDYAQGYYGSALRRYYQARDSMLQNNIDNPVLLAELKLWMANCLVKLNRAQEACQLIEEAVEVYRRLGTSLQTSDALREYATVLVVSGRLREAQAALDEAWTLFTRGGFEHYASATKLQQAELLLEVGSVAEAYNQAKLLREYFTSQGIVARSVRAALVMAGALIETERQTDVGQESEPQSIRLQEAASLCDQASCDSRRHNLQEQAYKSQYLLGQIAMVQNDNAKAAKHYRSAIDQIERILDDLVYDLSPSFLRSTWAVYEDMIDLCLRRGQTAQAFSYLERARSMALRQYLNKSKMPLDERGTQANSAMVLRTQYELREWQEKYRDYGVLLADLDISVSPTIDREIIQAELHRCEAKLSELFERLHLYQSEKPITSHTSRSKRRQKPEDAMHFMQRVDIKQVRQHLLPNQLLLAYFLSKNRLVTFAITPKRLITYENPNGVEQLERLLPLLHAHLDPRGWSDFQNPPQQNIRRLLKKLYDLLMAPVASLLPSPPGYLTIVPYGPLHKLPFHALHDGSHYLIENFQINYLPASSMLTQFGTHRSEQNIHPLYPEVSDRSPLVFGYSENGHLQRALDEARIVAELLKGRCYLEDEATISRLIGQAPGSSIIHLATHGQSRLDSPNFSYLRLADGQLNAIDAFSLELKGCELVTLSGCETGLALSGGGDEQLGLGRAFLAAGAASLVMSLWSVEDNATNDLMQLFYQNLLRGDSKVQALRAAQCNLLHRPSSTYTHPYFWAAFRLVGEVDPLMYQNAEAQAFAFKTEALKK